MTWTFPPPSPMPPKVIVTLTPGTGQAAVDITGYLSQETAPILTTTIENPVDTNSFTAADVTLKGYDTRTGTIKTLFTGIRPTSIDYSIRIDLRMPGTDQNGALSYLTDLSFSGYVAPTTLSFNPKDYSFSFTVIGLARNFQTTSATSLFQRTGYSDTKWTLQQDATPQDQSIRVTATTGTANLVPDFFAGDTIRIGDSDEITITNVEADVSASPPGYWILSFPVPLTKKYAVGSAVVLLTPYARNMSLRTVVRQLFVAAGFTNDGYFASAALPNIPGVLFATPINVSGLPGNGASITGIAPFLGKLIVGTPEGIYQSTSPISPFTLLAPYKLPPVDPTNSRTSYVYTGPKRTKTRNNAPRYGLSVTMKFYAYDWKQYGGTYNRYILTVTCNADVDSPTFAFTTKLEWQTYTTATDSWGGTTTLWAGIDDTTNTDLSKIYDGIGIDVDPATGTIFFTDLDVASSGGQITMNTSAYQPTGATPATGTLARNKVTGLNGPTVFIFPGFVTVFQVDGILGQPPTAKTYTTVADGTMTLNSTTGISPYVVGRSIKFNAGDNRWYMLVSDPQKGILLTSWPVGSGPPDALLFPPPFRPVQATNLLGTPFEVDLMCLPTGAQGSGTYPMVALIGGTPHYISNTGSGLIPYVDMTDLSVGDALQQLSVINAGIFYLASSRNYGVFRPRSVPATGDTIGTSDQIDGDNGVLTLTTQNVWNRWVGYVRIEHESDETIFGEAGDPAYADSDLGLTLKSRFVSSPSFARALAQSLFNYIGSQKRWIELERVRDGRTYEVGRTFHCNVDNLNRTFQIIETGHPIAGATVKVVGLEV